jgi:hypothetical protein
MLDGGLGLDSSHLQVVVYLFPFPMVGFNTVGILLFLRFSLKGFVCYLIR